MIQMEKYSLLKQIVPSSLCLVCDVCCRFPEEESPLSPYFTGEEIGFMTALERQNLPVDTRVQGRGKVRPIPHGEGCICPYFDPTTHFCRIYSKRPLDCRIYPFAIMRDLEGSIVLGIDTKCPFIMEHAEEIQGGNTQEGNTINEIVDFLESDSILQVFTANPAFVGSYQEDVIILHPLRRLNAAMAVLPSTA